MTDEEVAYRALTGIDYRSAATGKEVRVEKGDKITDMNNVAIKHELRAGNIEKWEPRKTENVKTDDEVEVTGVKVRHRGEQRDLEVKEV